MEYSTKEFAAEVTKRLPGDLKCTDRILEHWRNNEESERFMPHHYVDNIAVYTDEQIPDAIKRFLKHKKKYTEFVVDEEFVKLIPPLSEAEFVQLEENILSEGIREPLIVWKDHGILIDGHNRYKIAQKHNLPFLTIEKVLNDREAVKGWIIRNQLGRRNLNLYSRGELALKLKPMISNRARENQGTRNDLSGQDNFLANLPKSSSVNTRDELAKKANVSSRTMAMIKFLVENATTEIKSALRLDEFSINAAYEAVKAGAETVDDVKEFKKRKKNLRAVEQTDTVSNTTIALELANQSVDESEPSSVTLPVATVAEFVSENSLLNEEISSSKGELEVEPINNNESVDSFKKIVSVNSEEDSEQLRAHHEEKGNTDSKNTIEDSVTLDDFEYRSSAEGDYEDVHASFVTCESTGTSLDCEDRERVLEYLFEQLTDRVSVVNDITWTLIKKSLQELIENCRADN